MSIATLSRSEYPVIVLSNGSNVTAMRNNSMGSDEDITYLFLPSVVTMAYTDFGVYTPEGGQTQRIGLSPDIYAEPTVAGVREGRDELIEAAMKFIISQ